MKEESFPSRQRQPVTTKEFHDLVALAAYDRWQNAGAPIPGNEQEDWTCAEIEITKGFYVAQESETEPVAEVPSPAPVTTTEPTKAPAA